MMYQGLVKVIGLRTATIRFEQTEFDTEFFIDVLISDQPMPAVGLRMSTKESGFVPEVGSYISVLINDKKLVIIGE
jgi:hypothetical protein